LVSIKELYYDARPTKAQDYYINNLEKLKPHNTSYALQPLTAISPTTSMEFNLHSIMAMS